MSKKQNEIPERKGIKITDTWDLGSLFVNDHAWENGLSSLEASIAKIATFKGTLSISAKTLADALNYTIGKLGLLEEKLGYYVMLRQSENIADAQVQGMHSRYMNIATKLAAALSWVDPEIQGIDEKLMKDFLEDELLSDYRIYLSKLLRFRDHVLSDKEESLLAKQLESTQVPSRAFSALTNVDMDFGSVKTSDGEKPLTQSTYSTFLLDKDRSVRESAFRAMYRVFDAHKNSLTQLYVGAVLRNKYIAEVRGYPSARAKALFPDRVPEKVYDNLVRSVRENLPALHDYYQLRSELLRLPGTLRHWDVYVSLVDIVDARHSWDEAVELICDAMRSLGSEYVNTLRGGLLGRWADRYENKGKRSGAFSAGSYSGKPYILMNYQESVLRDVFILAHESGHSMHSWYSVRNNPFPHYNYSIFEAEVASTFNEQLLADKLIKENSDKSMKAFLLTKQIDDVIATIYRQTMFAEFERDIHAMAENGEPLTLESLRGAYRKLLTDYFGKAMNLEDVSDLECFRIPHFYHAFYVYKYATGLSAAMALSERVLAGNKAERDDYLSFLKSGGSLYPIESLKLAGVDMSMSEPITTALGKFASLVSEFRQLTGN